MGAAKPLRSLIRLLRKPGPDPEEQFRKYPVWPYSGTPKEWIDRKDPNFTPSIYAEPRSTLDPTVIGEIKGRPDVIKQYVRKIMQRDAKATNYIGKPSPIEGMSQEDADFYRRLIRGTWWHGRGTEPPKNVASTLSSTRRKTGLYGEPVGSSLTKSLSTAEEMFGPKLLRVKPEIGGDPLEKILFHQYEPHAKIMNEAYEETAKGFKDKYPRLATMEGYYDLRNIVPTKEFNVALTKRLEEKGFRGVSYSPRERYGEYELKMFPGKQHEEMTGSDFVHYLDTRSAGLVDYSPDKATRKWERMVGKAIRTKWGEVAEGGKYHHLKEHYADVDLKKIGREIAEEKGVARPDKLSSGGKLTPQGQKLYNKLTDKGVYNEDFNYPDPPSEIKITDDTFKLLKSVDEWSAAEKKEATQDFLKNFEHGTKVPDHYKFELGNEDPGWMTTKEWLDKKDTLTTIFKSAGEKIFNTDFGNIVDHYIKAYKKGDVSQASEALKAIKALAELTTPEINYLIDLDAKETIMDLAKTTVGIGGQK